MRFFNTYSNNYEFVRLPAFSSFVLQEQLEPFVLTQMQISYETDLPLLKLLSNYTEEQKFNFLKGISAEFLGFLVENRGKQQIEQSMKRWEADQLQIIGKFDFEAEDITLFNFIRGKSLRQFIPLFSSEARVVLELIDELDTFLTGSTTAGTNTYFRILRDTIARSEQELLDAQRIANIGSFEWDLSTNKLNNSPEMFRIYDLTQATGPEELLEYVHPDDREKVKENMSRALEQGTFEYEYRFARNGLVKHIHSKGLVVYENEQPKKIIGTVQDITNRKHIEQELLEKKDALERSNESLRQFAHVASHDLKEPLRKISLLTDQVLRKEKNLSDSSEATLTKAHQSSVRMLQMIDDIMNYSTLTHWEERSESDLGEIVKEATDFLEQPIVDKNAVIVYNDLPVIHVIGSQIRQLLQNLISNALKFSKSDVAPVINIEAAWLTPDEVTPEEIGSADKYLQVVVQDNGIGFDQEFSKQIFNLFSRLHSKAMYDGSGLGLAIAKKIIDNHNGTITAVSQKGEGATFTFIIPQ